MSPADPHGPFSPHPLPIPTAHGPERGLFISFEGGDGAGKTTQMAMLRDHLVGVRRFSDDLILTTREPGGTPLGEQIRTLLLHGDDVEEQAEALLYAADRAHHVATVVRPHLARGGMVLADRYIDSSVAYQGAGRSLDPSQIAALSLWATKGLLPHRTILLDMPPSALKDRRSPGELDRLEQAGFEFHTKVRQQFLELARSEPERYAVIDAALPREEVHAQVLEAIGDLLDALDPTFTPETGTGHRDEQ